MNGDKASPYNCLHILPIVDGPLMVSSAIQYKLISLNNDLSVNSKQRVLPFSLQCNGGSEKLTPSSFPTLSRPQSHFFLEVKESLFLYS